MHIFLARTLNIKDGCGIHDILIPAGIVPVIITGRRSDIVLNRCREIGITEIYQGVSNKIEMLQEVTADLSTVAYIGDDINDLSCMVRIKEAGGTVGCPADSAKKVIKLADFISEHNGGDGAVRDYIEWIIDMQL